MIDINELTYIAATNALGMESIRNVNLGVKVDAYKAELFLHGFDAGVEWERNRGKWIAMSEQEPDIGQWAMFHCPSTTRKIPAIGNYKGNGKFLCIEDNDFWIAKTDGITHWQPIPEPPKPNTK